jgi:hypothetical protein
MADNNKLIGNEVSSGTNALSPKLKITSQRIATDYRMLKQRRQQLVDTAATPPPIPLANIVLPPKIVENNHFNQIAYSVLLIALLAIIASTTNFINWEFLAYGLLAILARLPSTQMFIAAIFSIIIVPIALTLQRGTIANNFSVMAFYFLLIGLLRSALELRRASKNKKKIIGNKQLR